MKFRHSVKFFFTLIYRSSRDLRVRLEIASIDTLDQLLRHLDDLLTACWNRQHIIDQWKRRHRQRPIDQQKDRRSGLIPTHRTAQQSHARIFINFYVLRQRLLLSINEVFREKKSPVATATENGKN